MLVLLRVVRLGCVLDPWFATWSERNYKKACMTYLSHVGCAETCMTY